MLTMTTSPNAADPKARAQAHTATIPPATAPVNAAPPPNPAAFADPRKAAPATAPAPTLAGLNAPAAPDRPSIAGVGVGAALSRMTLTSDTAAEITQAAE